MYMNYLKIAFRNLARQKGFTFINIIGLSVGIASAMLIFMFVYNEMNFDNFHKQSKNIYRIYQSSHFNGQEINSAITPVPMGPTLKADFPEVLYSSRLNEDENLMVERDQKYYTLQGMHVDSTFLKIFSFPLVSGDFQKVLSEPHTVVLTKSAANKLFGKENPMNMMIHFVNDSALYRVAGVCSDPPSNSHFYFDLLISFDSYYDVKSTFWLNNNLYTYVLLPEKYPYHELEKKFPEMVKKYIAPQVQEVAGISLEEFEKKGSVIGFKLQPLEDIHLNTFIDHGLKPSSNKKYLYIFTIIGIFIIVIAGINFMNLSTARSAARAREVGMRKVLGSDRKRLIQQFLAESILLSFFSLIVAILLLELFLPEINRMLHVTLSFSLLGSWQYIGILLAFTIGIGIFAGFYPAFLLSSFRPSAIFKDKLHTGSSGNLLRSILVVIQFFIAIVILSGTFVVYRQLKYLQSKELGFDKEKLMIIDRGSALSKKLSPFIAEVKKLPRVVDVSNSTSIPGFPNSDNGFMVEGRSLTLIYDMVTNWVDHSFLNTMRIPIKEGRFFSADLASDSLAVVLNESAVKKMDLKNPIGTRIMEPNRDGKYIYRPIIGVVKDFHFRSLHSAIEPYIMIIKSKEMEWNGVIAIRIGPGDLKEAIHQIESIWKVYTNSQPMDYSFLDEKLNSLYAEEQRTGSLSLVFTVLAILVACLGLLGLISYTTVQRTKEIGIRKILGASTSKIVRILSLETIRLIIIASLLAWPVAYYFLHGWLADFAYKIGLNPLIFLIPTLIIFVLSLITIGYQAIYAATRNPADSLRYE
jgi:putative ABC transport system permease protein